MDCCKEVCSSKQVKDGGYGIVKNQAQAQSCMFIRDRYYHPIKLQICSAIINNACFFDVTRVLNRNRIHDLSHNPGGVHRPGGETLCWTSRYGKLSMRDAGQKSFQ